MSYIKRAKIGQLIKWLVESPPPKFNMSYWFEDSNREVFSSLDALMVQVKAAGKEIHTCGFAACLAGTIQYKTAKTLDDKWESTGYFANGWLGVHREESTPLFCSAKFYGKEDLEKIKKEEVINTLIWLYNSDKLPHTLLDEWEIDTRCSHDNEIPSFIKWHKQTNQKLRKPSLHYKLK